MKSLCHVGRYNRKVSLPHCLIFRIKSGFTFLLPVLMTDIQRTYKVCAGKWDPEKTPWSCWRLAPVSQLHPSAASAQHPQPDSCCLHSRVRKDTGGTIRSILVPPRSSEVKVLCLGFSPRKVITPPHQDSPSYQVKCIWRPACLN